MVNSNMLAAHLDYTCLEFLPQISLASRYQHKKEKHCQLFQKIMYDPTIFSSFQFQIADCVYESFYKAKKLDDMADSFFQGIVFVEWLLNSRTLGQLVHDLAMLRKPKKTKKPKRDLKKIRISSSKDSDSNKKEVIVISSDSD